MKREMIFGISGFAAGSVCGAFGMLFYYRKKLQKEIAEWKEELLQEMQQDFEVKEEYKRQSKTYTEEKSETGRENGPLDPVTRKEIKEKLKRNWEGTTNYAGIYQPHHKSPDVVDPEEKESPRENDTEIPELVDRKMRDPKIISVEDAGNLMPDITSTCLYYYVDEDIIVDEDGNVVEDYERLLGKCLDKYGFKNDDESLIFVMNSEINTCFEIQKVYGEFDG